MKVLNKVLALGFTAVIASACSGNVGDMLGLNKDTPDEFTVVTRAPLVLPPDYGLRPPDPRAKRAEEDRAKDVAQAALFGIESNRTKRKVEEEARNEFPSGEVAILKQADALGASSDIRELVDAESDALALANERFVDVLMFWKEPEEDGVKIDAVAENERLTENAGLGRPLTEGDTPMIRRDSDSLF